MAPIKIAIVHNKEERTLAILPKLFQLLEAQGLVLDQDHPDVVISVGGDGMLLSAFHRYNHWLNEVRFLGVHTGHLGFYTDWRDYELEDMVKSLCQIKHNTESVSYPLLDVVARYSDEKQPAHFLALNESTIRRIGKTMVAEVYLNDDLFEKFRGDGLSLSTPTGSTAYNKSIGGAVLPPEIQAFQLTEIASLNNTVFKTLGSPLVISKDATVSIRLKDADDYFLSVDQLSIANNAISRIDYRLADEQIRFVPTRHMPFFKRVKDAFIGEQ